MCCKKKCKTFYTIVWPESRLAATDFLSKNPQLCGVITIILLLWIESESPRSQMVHIKHVLTLDQAVGGGIPAIAKESEQVSPTVCFVLL